nr:MAG TPA: hypothetical protein [Caudoviricetes sp.]
MNNEVKTGVYTLDGEDTPFAFYTSLSAYRKSQFVVSVSNILVGDNYNYVIRDLAFDFCIVAIFTDIDTADVQDADDGITAMEEFVEKFKPVIDIVKANIEDGVLDELRTAIDLNIEYRTGIHINPISSSLASFLDTIERKVDGIDLNSMMDLAQSMAGISDELTADKLLDAYAKTNIFKEHWGDSNKDDTVEDNGFSVVYGSDSVAADAKVATAPISSATE